MTSNLEPGTSAVNVRPCMPYIGFCLVFATLVHRESIGEAVHPDATYDKVLRDGIERQIQREVRRQAYFAYEHNPPSDLVVARQSYTKRNADSILGPYNVIVCTFAYGTTYEERELNAARLEPDDYPFYEEDEADLLRRMRMKAGIVSIEDLVEFTPAHDHVPWSV